MRARFFLFVGSFLWAAVGAVAELDAQPAVDYAEWQRRAAQAYSEQSYGRAHEAWTAAARLEVPAGERRTLDFYLADSLWRSRPAAGRIASARKQLEALAAGSDELAAESAESLGDSWLAIENDWERSWKEYRAALKFWAAATDIEAARPRYLGIVWKATGPPEVHEWSREVPLEELANALSIARNDEDRARAHFFLGCWHARTGEAFSLRRARREFQSAVDAGPATAVFEAALFRLAWLNLSAGTAEWRADGRILLGPDYGQALELFQRFVREFPAGRSKFTAEAAEQIRQITRPDLEVEAAEQYLPGAKPVVQASWRNVGDVTFTVSRVDLERDFHPTTDTSPERWLDAVRIPAGTRIRQWSESDAPKETHARRDKRIELGALDEPGTYLVEARGGTSRSRTLVVVTAGSAILRSVGSRAVAFFCDARTGARAEKVSARLWQVRSQDRAWIWSEGKPAAPEAGLVRFDLPEAARGWGGRAFLFGRAGAQPSVTRGHIVGVDDEAEKWKIQVFTDRAAYRPSDVVRWKIIARRGEGGAYVTPAGEPLKFKIVDPNGEEADRGEVKLTEFGGAWGEVVLKPESPLGEYAIEFSRGKDEIDGATLFRLEEYRLPEFKVNVAIAPGGGSGVRLGDEIAAKISAEYYFGGAVAGAKIAVEIREEPVARPSPREDRSERLRPAPGPGSRIVKSETVRTGPDGTATIRFPTPLDAPEDLRYAITARVEDATGRQVVGSGDLVVGRQSYFAELTPSRHVAVPGDRIDVTLETKDGNNRRVPAKGVLAISRRRWVEIWLDPQGHEVSGAALDKWRQGVFPPGGQPGWRLVRQEYVDEKVDQVPISTDAEGRGAYRFLAAGEGFYRLAWSSPDEDGPPVTTEANVWVSTTAGGTIGYRSGGVGIIVDPAAPARNGKVPVLITTDSSNRDVLFSVHAEGNLFRAEVVHLDGDSKLVELDHDERFVPNVFVSVAAIRGLEYFAETRPVAFPPDARTLAVKLRAGAEEVRPGADSTFDLEVKDADGRPVRGEFALGVSDEALSSIQAEYAGDPVRFFWGEERADRGWSGSSVSRLPFPGENAGRLAAASDGEARGGGESAFGAVQKNIPAGASVPAALPMESFMEVLSVVEEEPTVTVRADFSATAFWDPRVLTNEAGMATVKFRYPDSLTTWKAVLRGATAGAEFGFAEAATRTTLPLIARLQTPRFLVAGDRVVLSGVIDNRTPQPVDARADLRVEGLSGATRSKSVRVEGNGDARVEWPLEAVDSGTAKITLSATAGKAGDGLKTELPVHPNGIEKAISISGKAVGSTTKWTLVLPAERRHGSETLVVNATPSLAATALDALPYLVSYPYGCVEQTMSRFLPAAVTARTLQGLGLDRGSVARRIYGGIERKFLSKTHPRMDGAAGLEELDAAIASGLARLGDFQHGDGGWGWWKDDESDPFMTAYVVWGLRLARQAGVPVRSDLIEPGRDWLRKHLVDAKAEPDLQAWLLHALGGRPESGDQTAATGERAAFDNLWVNRDRLSAYGRALFALAAHDLGESAKAGILARNLRDGVRLDAGPGVSAGAGAGAAGPAAVPTAHWGSDGIFRRWPDGGVEATAFALQALLAIEPTSDLVEPAMNWLVKNRRGAQWSNTRDTAITVLALNRYLAATKELGKSASFEIDVNGKKAGEVEGATALDGRARFEIDPALLRDGENEILLRAADGAPPIYVAAQAKFFTLEQPIPAAGNEVFVKRDYLLSTPRRTLLDGYRFDRRPWKEGEPAAAGSRVDVELTLEAKNDLEYLLVEDLKPAGLEAVGGRSGEAMTASGPDGRTAPVYCELRDRKVAFFIRRLSPGTWKIRYEMRAETPGNFSALPVMGEAMYAPEIRGNGESRRVEIR